MTLVVADASPVSYLLMIEAGHVFPQLYDQVIIPQTVLAELSHPHAPAVVRLWAAALPEWATVRSASRIQFEGRLDPGEAEAIALAQELNADCVLLDDRDARREAIALGLTVAGTVGVLEQAAERDLINLPDAFERNIEPIVVHDACASQHGLEVHETAKFLLARLIGEQQLLSTAEAVEGLSNALQET